ncbi:fatty acid desaturase [Patescibacteria group bacterium]|nr:fatty acid desaturase [Patescibacteria group bacterium]
MIDHFLLQVLNAIFLAFTFGQIGFLGHDAGHRQIFNIVRRNDFLGLFVNFLLGISRSWWVDQHNEHHASPNVLEKDPHTNIPIIAFDQGQAIEKTRFLQTII